MSPVETAQPLREWYVISLRPQGQHAGMRRAAAKHGARVFALSTLVLQPLPAPLMLKKALACDRVIVTSPVAIQMAHAQQPLQCLPNQRWFVLGKTSANALNRLGIANVVCPAAGANSEALLACPELADIHGAVIGLITAPNGRDLLHQELQRRGAQLLIANVYQRVATPPALARRQALQALPTKTALLVSSAEALTVLWHSLENTEKNALRVRPAIAASTRLATVLTDFGFSNVLVADDARPQSLLNRLVNHAETARLE